MDQKANGISVLFGPWVKSKLKSSQESETIPRNRIRNRFTFVGRNQNPDPTSQGKDSISRQQIRLPRTQSMLITMDCWNILGRFVVSG